jgi:hypothetical protein
MFEDVEELLSLYALGNAPAPSPEVKARLMASVGGGRFEAFAARTGALFDVGLDRARELLGLIERTASWVPLAPGIAMVPLVGGPAVAAGHCAFLRLAAGATFPLHRHVGEEAAIVLAGRVRDAGGEHGPGDGWTLAAGTRHELVGASDDDCICAVRALGGILVGA